MSESETMMFIDKNINDETINVIETMFYHHMLGNYQEVKNIILGYDSKKNVWISKYGEYLSRKKNDYQLDTCIKNFEKKGMIFDEEFEKKSMVFSNGDAYENVRILTDAGVRRILDILFTVSKNVIEYRQIIDIIIAESIKNNVLLSNTNIDLDGNLRYQNLEMREDLWKNLKRISKRNGSNISNTFKNAVIEFLEHRAEMLNDNKYE